MRFMVKQRRLFWKAFTKTTRPRTPGIVVACGGLALLGTVWDTQMHRCSVFLELGIEWNQLIDYHRLIVSH
ncbi:unnamed protein product [Durusdinium trenchii]|uniref:Uncharacterized protein n=1 Tax=Durusdinium trenchii TaxID=1381693 RepID=A0ABP0JA36_9DINO